MIKPDPRIILFLLFVRALLLIFLPIFVLWDAINQELYQNNESLTIAKQKKDFFVFSDLFKITQKS